MIEIPELFSAIFTVALNDSVDQITSGPLSHLKIMKVYS